MGWPDPAQIVQAAKAAGGWIRDQVAAASQAGVARARKLADAAENAASGAVNQVSNAVQRKLYDKLTGLRPETVDALSERVAHASEAYQSRKAEVVNAFARAKQMFGADPPTNVVAHCPVANGVGNAEPQDGGFLVPTEACPADSIPVGDDGVAAALEKAKSATVSSTSKCCAGASPEAKNRTIYYVNGINTSPEGHCETLRMLRDMTCGKVVGILNKTEGGLTDSLRTGDARQMIKDEIGGGVPRSYPGFTPAVQTMKEVMFSELSSGGNPLVFAHSEGGAITSLAAVRTKAALANGGLKSSIQNLSIISMGSAAPAWTDGPNYEHFVHVSDIVPDKLGLGIPGSRPGAGAKVIRFGGSKGHYMTESEVPLPQFKDWQPGDNWIAEHLVGSSYLPYINQMEGGCLGQP